MQYGSMNFPIRPVIEEIESIGRLGFDFMELAMDALRTPDPQQKIGVLSGGERRRVALCRLLLQEPDVLLLDEPSMGLAPVLKYELFRKLKQLNEEGMTILLVEQNAKLALQLAHRGYVLDTGNIAAEGTGQELLENPEVKKAYLGG